MSESSQTLARGLRLLDLLAAGREGTPVRELAAAIGLPRSIVQRLLVTLEANGYIERHPSQVGYRLAIKLWSLGCVAARRLNVLEVAHPYLEEIARKTGEMAKIGVLDGCDVVYVDKVDSARAVRAYVPLGGRAPALAVATGKAILAFLSAERLAAFTAAIGKNARGTSTELAAAELEQIRRRGYAVNRGEWEADVGAIAAPIFDARNEVLASIGIILPAHRLTAAKANTTGTLIKTVAAEVSRKPGHDGREQSRPTKRAG